MNILKKTIIIIVAIIFIMFFLGVFMFFEYKNLAYLDIRNNIGNDIHVKINNKDYNLGKYNGIEISPFSGKAHIEVINMKDNSLSCDLEIMPFRLCSFEIYINEGAIICGTCTQM